MPAPTFQSLMTAGLRALRTHGGILLQLSALYGAITMILGRLWRDDLIRAAEAMQDDTKDIQIAEFAPSLLLAMGASLAVATFLLVIWARVCFTPGAAILDGGFARLSQRWFGAASDLLLSGVILALVIFVASLAGQLLTGLTGGGTGFLLTLTAFAAFVPATIILAAFLTALCARAHDQTPRLIPIIKTYQPMWLAVAGFILFCWLGAGFISVFFTTLIGGVAGNDLSSPSAIAAMFVDAVMDFLLLGFLTAAFGSIWRENTRPIGPRSL